MKQSDYKERSNQKALALFFILFFLAVVATCSAQNRDYPQKMKFSCEKTDTVYVSIDYEEAFDVYHLTVSCTKHNHSEWKSITIGFVDGTALEVFQDYGWLITDENLLFNTEFDFLSFDEENSSAACINIKTQDYFTKYYLQVEK